MHKLYKLWVPRVPKIVLTGRSRSSKALCFNTKSWRTTSPARFRTQTIVTLQPGRENPWIAKMYASVKKVTNCKVLLLSFPPDTLLHATLKYINAEENHPDVALTSPDTDFQLRVIQIFDIISKKPIQYLCYNWFENHVKAVKRSSLYGINVKYVNVTPYSHHTHHPYSG